MLRLAFIGVDHPHGAHWRQTLANLTDRIEITALMPGYGGGTTSLEERFSQVPRFATVEELIAKGDFEAALVALPNNEGPTVIQKLAEAGKHVLVEKPGAAIAAAMRPAIEAVRRRKVAFQNGYMWRYDAGAERLREMVRDGRFGKLIHLEMTFVTSDARRRGPDHYLFDPDVSGSGFFNWLGCHQIDLVPFVTGQRIVAATARVGVFGATDVKVEDGGAAILELEGGGLATLVGGYWLPRWAGEHRWVIRGTERWVEWLPTKPGTGGEFAIHGPQPQWHAMEETFTLAVDTVQAYGGARGVKLVSEWVDAIAQKRDCRNTPESTLAALAVLDAVHESSRTGRRVEVAAV